MAIWLHKPMKLSSYHSMTATVYGTICYNYILARKWLLRQIVIGSVTAGPAQVWHCLGIWSQYAHFGYRGSTIPGPFLAVLGGMPGPAVAKLAVPYQVTGGQFTDLIICPCSPCRLHWCAWALMSLLSISFASLLTLTSPDAAICATVYVLLSA